MKRFLSIILSLITISLAITFSGCQQSGDNADFYNFTTQIHVEVYKGKLSNSVKEQIKTTLDDLENTFSISRQTSLPSRFNLSSANQTITLTQTEQTVVKKAIWGYDWTDGKFNPAVYPLSVLWGFAPTFDKHNFVKPSDEQIQQILNSGATSFDNSIILQNNTLTKVIDSAKIDFGGIVKGYACDLIANILKNAGFNEGYVSVGTSSINLLSVSSLGIAHPRKNGQIVKIKDNLKDLSVSTSGDYERFFDKDGVRYCHIIDGMTGNPTQTGVQSATVLCPDGMVADILSTALCLCEYSQTNDTLSPMINKIVALYPNALVFVAVQNKDGKSIVTNAKKGEQFTLFDNDYSVVKI